MFGTIDTISMQYAVADRRRRLERAAREHRAVTAAIGAAFAAARGRPRASAADLRRRRTDDLRRRRTDLAVALPAAAPTRSTDRTPSSWPAERVA